MGICVYRQVQKLGRVETPYIYTIAKQSLAAHVPIIPDGGDGILLLPAAPLLLHPQKNSVTLPQASSSVSTNSFSLVQVSAIIV
jgi:hypothetical protein